jgi:hypothetical protein
MVTLSSPRRYQAEVKTKISKTTPCKVGICPVRDVFAALQHGPETNKPNLISSHFSAYAGRHASMMMEVSPTVRLFSF